MKTLMNKLREEEDKLNQELEESHENYEIMKMVFEKKIQLYNRYITEDDLTDVDRLMLSNKREWIMSHLLSLIIDEEATNKFSELTKRVYELEKTVQALQDFINNNGR